MTEEEINSCTSGFIGIDFVSPPYIDEEQEIRFCSGELFSQGKDFQDALDDCFFTSQELEYLEVQNYIRDLRKEETTDEWVDGRVVLTTTEWNNLSSNPISFKIRVESNEIIW